MLTVDRRWAGGRTEWSPLACERRLEALIEMNDPATAAGERWIKDRMVLCGKVRIAVIRRE